MRRLLWLALVLAALPGFAASCGKTTRPAVGHSNPHLDCEQLLTDGEDN